MSGLSVEAFADGWAAATWRASWQGGIAVALVWITCAIAPAIPPRIRCWLWRLAAVKLILGLVWISPIPVAVLPPEVHTKAPIAAPALVQLIAPPVENSLEMPLPRGNDPIAFAPVQAMPTSVQPLPKPVQTSTPIHWASVVLLLWICGAAVGFCRLAFNWRRAQRIRIQQIPIASDTISAIVNQLCIQLKIAHPPKIALSDSRVGPVLIGLFQPTILLPKSWSDSNAVNFREMALAHELAHFRRRDLLWSWLTAFTGVLFFFHPLAWLLCRKSAISADAACDAEALAATECDRRLYADLLLNLAANHAGLYPGGFGMLGMIETVGSLKKRLRNLMNARIPSRRMVFIAGMLIAVLAVPGLVNWRLVRRAIADEAAKPTTLPATQPTAESLRIIGHVFGPDGKPISGSTVVYLVANSSKLILADAATSQPTPEDRETIQHAIASLTTIARTYQARKDYEGMLHVLDQILALQPNNDYAVQMRPLIEDEAGNQHMMELANQRPNRSAPSTRLSDADQAAWKILLMELPKDQFDATDLGEVITFLKDVTGANIQVNWTALKTLNIDRDTPVSLSMSNFLVEKALQLTLDQAAGGAGKLKFVLRDGIIEISTVDDLKTQSTTKPADEPVPK